MACADICPKGAVTIKDDLSACNAVIDSEKCIGCDCCYNVCQQNHPPQLTPPRKWAQGWCADLAGRQKGSSGGFAFAISTAFIKSGGSVCSCVFTGGKFTFEFAESVDDVKKFSGSKYVKSNPSGIYKAIKARLKSGEKVLFIGLPCQVSALKNFVGKELESALYTVDLICHGTPSPKLLDMFLKQYKIQLSGVEEIKFRKNYKYQISCNGKSVAPDGVTDKYMTAFLNSLTHTDNCYSCNYAKTQRASDLTLGDSYGSELPESEWDKGVSLALCQTDKGIELLETADLVLKDVDLDRAVSKNDQLRAPSAVPKGREAFFKALRANKKFNSAIYLFLTKQCLRQDIKAVLIRLGLRGS